MLTFISNYLKKAQKISTIFVFKNSTRMFSNEKKNKLGLDSVFLFNNNNSKTWLTIIAFNLKSTD